MSGSLRCWIRAALSEERNSDRQTLVVDDDLHGGTWGLLSCLHARLRRQAALLGGLVVMALHVDVISDVICPWCFIGKRRLEKAIAAVDGPLGVRWLPF